MLTNNDAGDEPEITTDQDNAPVFSAEEAFCDAWDKGFKVGVAMEQKRLRQVMEPIAHRLDSLNARFVYRVFCQALNEN
jgi:hypothetical protein